MIDLIKEIWQTMRTNKLRTFLTGLSVAWGIFMLILLLAISNGVIKSFEQDALDEDPYQINVYGGSTTRPYKGLKEGREIKLRERQFDAVNRSDNQHITTITGSYEYSTTLSTSKDYVAANCKGVAPENKPGDLRIKHGRFINQADISGNRKVIVIPQKTAEALFHDPDKALGQVVNASSLAFTVVGVYDHRWRDDIYMPYTTAKALKGYDDKIEQMNISITNVSTEGESLEIEDNVRQALAKSEEFDPADDNAIWIRNRFRNMLQAMTALNILNITMWVIGILTLVTGIVGVSNIMFVSVRERTHEIGVRRAIGAKPRSILRQIVLESIAMTTAFGYAGVVMGTLACEAVTAAFAGSDIPIMPSVDLKIAIEVTIALIIAGALAGIFPARRATRVRPVEALRDE